MHKVIGFKAEGKEPSGKVYDCSFMISFPLMGVNISPQHIKNVVAKAIRQFQEYHPTGQITQQMERHIMMR